MFGIGQFFKKIQGSYAKEILARTLIKESIKKNSGIDVSIESINFKGTYVVIEGISHSARSALFIKKAAILRDIAVSGVDRTITDLR